MSVRNRVGFFNALFKVCKHYLGIAGNTVLHFHAVTETLNYRMHISYNPFGGALK